MSDTHVTPSVTSAGDVLIEELSPPPVAPPDHYHGRPSGRGGRTRELAARLGASVQSLFSGRADDRPQDARTRPPWVKRSRDRWRVSMQGHGAIDLEHFSEAVDVALTWLAGTTGRIYRQPFGGRPEPHEPGR